MLIIILDLVLLGLFGLFKYNISTPKEAGNSEPNTVIIEQGWSVKSIAAELQQEGLINNETYFTLHVLFEGKAHKLQAGVYELNPSMTIKEIAEILEGGATGDFVRVTIPEGFTKEQISIRLEEEGAITDRKQFLNIANVSTGRAAELYDYPFLSQIPANSLEGFLFPDTYEFHLETDANLAMEKFLANFESKTEGMPASYETLIIASLLEKEVQTEEDMKLVAGVINNRLEIGMALQLDATLAYITGKQTGQLTNTDKEIQHPYNTYQNRGLPPAPIANPGLKAINAALNPTPNDYIYYLSDAEGNTHFAETLEQHNENKANYLR